jgi:hypothetical protein
MKEWNNIDDKLNPILNEFYYYSLPNDFIKLRSDLESEGHTLGIRYLDEIEQLHLELQELKQSNDNKFFTLINLTTKFYLMMIPLIELMSYLRTIHLSKTIEEIDYSKSIEELCIIDQKLTSFLFHNELKTSLEGYYPVHLINEGKKQLERISQNYGKKKIDKLNNDDFIFEDAANIDIFLEEYNYQLFVYLAQNYAKEKRPVDLSHIYRWMDELNLIAKRSGKKYREFAVENNFVTGKYSRIDDPSRDSRTPLNELQKAFDKIRSKNE